MTGPEPYGKVSIVSFMDADFAEIEATIVAHLSGVEVEGKMDTITTTLSTPMGPNPFWRLWQDKIVGRSIMGGGNLSSQGADSSMGVSLKPSDAVAGGGGIDDVDVLISKCRFRLWDYNGTIQTPVLGLEVTFTDDDGGESSQVYSAGDTKHFVPSPDGSEAVAVGSVQNLNDSTNAMAFMVSLVNTGFPENKIGDKVSVFEGTRVHVNQVPQAKRKGLAGAKEGKTILLVSKIHSYPWDAAAAPAAKKASAPKATTPTAAPVQAGAQAPVAQAQAQESGEVSPFNQQAMDTLFGVVLGKGGQVPKAALAQEVFKVLASDPNRNAIVQLVYSDAFLKQAGAPWKFDGVTVSM